MAAQAKSTMPIIRFEDSFFIYLEKIAARKPSYPMSGKLNLNLNNLEMIFEQFVGMRLLRAFLDWPRKVKDPVLASMLYDILFSRLYGITLKLDKVFERMGIDLTFSLIQRFWIFRPSEIAGFKASSKNTEFEYFANDTLNQLWKMSKEYAPYLEWAYKKGLRERLEKGEKWPIDRKPFESIDAWLEFLDQDGDFRENGNFANGKKTGQRNRKKGPA